MSPFLSRSAAAIAIGAVAMGAVAFAVIGRSSPSSAPLSADAKSCHGAPEIPQRLRPSAIAVFDPADGRVLTTAVVGDAPSAVMTNGIVVTDAGDGWLRGFSTVQPVELAWCLQKKQALEPGAEGIVAVGDLVVAVSGPDVIAVRAATGELAWSAPVGEVVAGLSVGESRIYVWTFGAGSGQSRILALDAADGSAAKPQQLRPCALASPGSGCNVPVGPGKVVEAGGVVVFHASNERGSKVVAVDVETGKIAWEFPGQGNPMAVGDLIAIQDGTTHELVGIRADGERAFSIALQGFGATHADGVVLTLDQRLGPAGAQPGDRPPKTTALRATSTADGSGLWTAEVEGLPQRIDVAGEFVFTSSAEDITVVRLVDGAIAWHATLSTPARGGGFSVAGSWQLLGATVDGLVAIAAAEKPYRD